jgi:hypothetical protein
MPAENNSLPAPTFASPPVSEDHPGRYIGIVVSVPKVLQSWKKSLYSYEWLYADGRIKTLDELSEAEKAKRLRVEDTVRAGQPVNSPVLGIGVLDNIEIGMGRAEFLTLASYGLKTMPVMIPRSAESDFKAFRADVESEA